MFNRPVLWTAFAVSLIAMPLVGFAAQTTMSWEQIHPAVNALLNATCGVFLVLGYRAIKRQEINTHKRYMLSAFAASTLFLASYLIRYYLSGSHRYPGQGWDRTLYLLILISHMILAAAVVPLALRTLYLGLQDHRANHAAIARITWPIWLYVSVTGIIVYFMLYPIAGSLYGSQSPCAHAPCTKHLPQ